MLNPVASFCIYWVEMLIAYTYFCGIFEKRFSDRKITSIGFLIYSICSVLNLISGNNTTLNLCASVLATELFALYCYRGKLIQTIFYAFLLFVMNGTLEVITISFSTFITGYAFLDYNNNLLLFFFEAISSKGIYYLAVLVTIKILNPMGNDSRVPLNFLIYPIVSTCSLLVFWRVCAQPWCPRQIQLLMAIVGGCLFVSSVILFVTYSRQAEKDAEAIQMKSELDRLQTERSYYQILDQQNQQLMIYAHDTKKHLAAIQALNDDSRINSYVTELSRQLADYTHNCHSGNKLLDVMIHKYIIDCEMRGIQFEYDVKVCNLSQLDDMDLVAILGNLMDNAVTAAEHASEKVISLNTVHRNSYSVIIISNSCDVPPSLLGDHLISTKIDAGAHGFGLKSVEKAIGKYQGDYDWEYDAEEKVFTVTVMIEDKIGYKRAKHT